jgi:hypothetical protein
MEDTGKYVWLEDETYGWLPVIYYLKNNKYIQFLISSFYIMTYLHTFKIKY